MKNTKLNLIIDLKDLYDLKLHLNLEIVVLQIKKIKESSL